MVGRRLFNTNVIGLGSGYLFLKGIGLQSRQKSGENRECHFTQCFDMDFKYEKDVNVMAALIQLGDQNHVETMSVASLRLHTVWLQLDNLTSDGDLS